MILGTICILLLILVLIQRPYFDQYANENLKELRTILYLSVIALSFIDLVV